MFSTVVVNKDVYVKIIWVLAVSLVTFRMSRRRREMYSGHARLYVPVCQQPHAHTIALTRM